MDTLRVRPNPMPYAGSQLPTILIEINGVIFAEHTAEFFAWNTEVFTKVCGECFSPSSPSCAPPDIQVRRHEDNIYRYRPDSVTWGVKAAGRRMWCFTRGEYERALFGSVEELTGFQSPEIDEFVAGGRIFPREMGLYSIPDLPDDPQGRRFLESVLAVVKAGGFQVTDAPLRFVSIQVGVETKGVPECVVEIGMAENRCAIRFVENPTFPIWVTSDEVDHCMMDYGV